MKFSRYLVGLIAAVGVGSFALAQEQTDVTTGMQRAYKHSIGTYLVDQDGHTLYFRSGESDSSAGDWQPVLMGAELNSGPGIDAHLIGATALDGELIQFTYGGFPLYRYSGDSSTGDLTGHGLGGSAYAVSAEGQPIGANPAQFSAGPATERVERAYMHGFGTFLVDAQGFSLYAFTQDESDSSAVNWPPLIAGTDVTVGSGLDSALLGTVVRDDGSEQLTYAGHPLYRFSGDDGIGNVAGQGADDSWFLVSTDGSLLSDAASESADTEAVEAAAETDAGEPEEVTEVAPVSDVPAEVMAMGATVYGSGTTPSCASCHGAEGEGGAGPSLQASSALENNERIIRTVLRGGHIMPAFGTQLTDERVAAVLTFMRNSWGNDQGVISTDEVASDR